MPDPSARSLLDIYQVQLGRFLTQNDFNNDIRTNLAPLVSSCIVMVSLFLNSKFIYNLFYQKLLKVIQNIYINVTYTEQISLYI
jgi:hypothetical protein